MKKLFIKTYGCQMNFYDSARMADLLAPIGYRIVADAGEADMAILNTCHIREKAVEKVYSELGRLRKLKDEKADRGEEFLIAVAGCVAQAEGEEMARRQPAIDMVVGPQSYHRLPEMIARAHRGKGHALALDFPALEKFDALPRPSAGGVGAFVTVQEGCDKFCAFCVVPYTRGPELSRPPADIEAEVRGVAEQGVREVTLLGQNVNAYRSEEGWSFARLIQSLARIAGIERIRYMTSHPREMSDDLIAAHGEIEQLMPFLHLPVQSGSDRVLAAMNRRHSADDYLCTIERLRHARPDIALSSDFIVGFPGESEKDFEGTLDLARAVGFAQSFSFKYSPRPGTPASAMAGQVPDEVKSARLEILQQLLLDARDQFNRASIGHTVPVLFEKPGRRPGQTVGRSPHFQPLHVAGAEALIGEIRNVRIEELTANSLRGVLAPQNSPVFKALIH